MGMSIDEAIRILNTLSAFKRVNITGNELDDLCKLAIDTMCKYQKIEEIMHIEMNGKEALQEIERILRGK